jgi:membrane protein
MDLNEVPDLFLSAFFEWLRDRAPMLAASTAYYVLLSLAPALMLLVVFLGWFLGRMEAQSSVMGQIDVLAGPLVRDAFESVITSLLNPSSSYTATVVGLIFLFIGAAGGFVQIRDAFRVIWGGWGIQAPVLESTLYTVIAYLLSSILVLVVGMLLLLSEMITRIVLPLLESLKIPLPLNLSWLYVVSLFSSTSMVIIFLAVIYKLLIAAKIPWSCAFLGAGVTTILLLLGNRVIELALSFSNMGSIYGAVSSILVFLMWLYYSAQIFYYGAEFIKVYYQRRWLPGPKSSKLPSESLELPSEPS